MMRLLFWLWGPAIRRHLEATRERPSGFDGMEYAYTMGGNDYYTWADLASMPAVRQKHIERCLRFADAGISHKTLEALVDLAEGHLLVALRKGKDADKSLARVGHLLGELRNRPKDVIPEEVYYDLAALFVARKGEDPRTFDASIHADKVQALMAAGRAGEDFFMQPPAWRRLLGSMLTTAKAFEALSISWMAQRQRMQSLIDLHSRKP